MNLLVWGFDKNIGLEIVNHLKTSKEINHLHWVANHPESESIFSYFNAQVSAEVVEDEPCYEYCYHQGLSKFIDLYSRHYKDNRFAFHDYIDVFRLVFNHCIRTVKKHEISHILFANIPHEGPDYLFYLIADFYGIKKVLCYQSIIQGRFFACSKISDFGTFETVKINSPFNRSLTKYEGDQWFYMAGTKPLIYKNTPKQFLKHLFRRKWEPFFREGYQYKRKRDYINSWLKGINFRQGDTFPANYIYFPLALQPELTTSALGGLYNDQVLAIERLANHLPPEWKIIVKENPKQTEVQRSGLFFKRLTATGALLADHTFPTSELILNSKGIALITGTAGWEGLRAGKPVLTFGQAWYQLLPGVTQYSDSFEFKTWANQKIDFDQLSDAYQKLMSMSLEGITDFAYAGQVKDFDKDSNAEKISRQVLQAFDCINRD